METEGDERGVRSRRNTLVLIAIARRWLGSPMTQTSAITQAIALINDNE